MNCTNCGAPLKKWATKCEYCGTEYDRNGEAMPTVICAEAPGTQTLRAEVCLDYGLLERHPKEGLRYAMDKLANTLAKEILKYATMTTSDDYRSFNTIIRAEVGVVDRSKYAPESELYERLEIARRIKRSMESW